MQTQNAFNDNLAKYVLMPLGGLLAASGAGPDYLAHVLAVLLVLPFVLFAPTAGWLSDRFAKSQVIRGAAWLQLVVLGLMALALWQRSLGMALGAFFLLAAQSTILAPAKMGVVKELVGSSRMAFASGVMEGTVVLAILAGQIGGGFWFDVGLKESGDGWSAALTPVLVIGIGGVISLLLAHGVERTKSMSVERFTPFKAVSHFRDLKEVWSVRVLKLSALGVAFFWGFGGFVLLVIFQLAKEANAGGLGTGSDNSWMLFYLSVGTALGSFLGGWISRHRIELGMTPLGGLVLTVAIIGAGLTPAGSGLFFFFLTGSGFGAALFLVPLQAYLTDEAPDEKRGAVLAASNLLNNLAGLFGVFLQFLLQYFGVGPQIQLLFASLLVVWSTCFVIRLLPREFVKLVVLGIVRRVYRIESFHADRMPKEGGVLLTPNHVSFVDVFILSMASPRHVRFLMVRNFFEVPIVGHVARMFDAIPISRSRAKDAIRVAAEAVAEGSVVCIFPEGQLTRTGMLNEIKSGYSLIARKADCPVLPVYIDGLWGSIFSAERGRFFWKKPREIPYGVRVSFGEPCAPKTDSLTLRAQLCREAGWVISHRREAVDSVLELLAMADPGGYAMRWWQGGELHSCLWRDVSKMLDGLRDPGRMAMGHRGAEEWLKEWQELMMLSAGELKGLVINALEWMEPGDFGEGTHPVLVHSEAEQVARRVGGMLLPLLTRVHVVMVDDSDTVETLCGIDDRESLRDAVGGKRMGALLESGGARFRDFRLYRFAGEAQAEGGESFPCYRGMIFEGRLISVSMPHPAVIRPNDTLQPGWKAGAYGRLLTGISVQPTETGLILESPMWPEKKTLAGYRSDLDGFLLEKS
jgi:acyl-[acyl-carrier-protein]-phospholipid O-acyltransferase/long-chain-fatty-acid--[acyl-carrier-protein] ligase